MWKVPLCLHWLLHHTKVYHRWMHYRNWIAALKEAHSFEWQLLAEQWSSFLATIPGLFTCCVAHSTCASVFLPPFLIMVSAKMFSEPQGTLGTVPWVATGANWQQGLVRAPLDLLMQHAIFYWTTSMCVYDSLRTHRDFLISVLFVVLF